MLATVRLLKRLKTIDCVTQWNSNEKRLAFLTSNRTINTNWIVSSLCGAVFFLHLQRPNWGLIEVHSFVRIWIWEVAAAGPCQVYPFMPGKKMSEKYKQIGAPMNQLPRPVTTGNYSRIESALSAVERGGTRWWFQKRKFTAILKLHCY